MKMILERRTLRSRLVRRSGAPHQIPPYYYIFLLGFAALLFWPLCVGRTLYWGDILLYFTPMLRFEQGVLQQGHIPLWNPTLLGGEPCVGNPQLGIFYPGTLLLPYVPVWLYLNSMIIGHVFIGGAAMTWYLKRWTHSPFAALLGGMVFMGSEYLVGRAQFPPMIFTAVYFPWMLNRLDYCLDTGCAYYIQHSEQSADCTLKALQALKAREAVLQRTFWFSHITLAVVAGLMILAAHPQMAYLILMFSMLYFFARLNRMARALQSTSLPLQSTSLPLPTILPTLQFFSQRDVQHGSQYDSQREVKYRMFLFIVRHSASVIGALLVGVALTSVQTLPALQLLQESSRRHLSNAQANRFLLEPAHLLTLLLPRYWGHPATSNYWGGGNAWESAFFVGWLPLLFGGIAIRHRWKQKGVQFWILSGTLGLWMAFGSAAGLYWIAFSLLPGLANFHDPARFLLYTVFAMSVLTALGWDTLAGNSLLQDWNNSLHLRLKIVCLLAIALPLIYYANDWNPNISTTSMQAIAAGPTQLTAIGKSIKIVKSIKEPVTQSGRLSLPAPETAWKHFITEGYTDYSTIRSDEMQPFLNAMLPNLGINDHILFSSGYEPVPVHAPEMLNDIANIAMRRGEPNLSRLMSLSDSRFVALPKSLHIFDPQFELLPSNEATSMRVWRNCDWLHTAWVVPHTHQIEGEVRIIAALAAPDFDPLKVAILCDAPLAHEPDLEMSDYADVINSSQVYREGQVYRKETKGTDEVQISVQNDTSFALLVLATIAYPGWKASLDTKPTPIHRVDGALMGVYVNRGQHQVDVKYVPASYYVGLYITLVAGCLLSIAMGLALTTERLQSAYKTFEHHQA